jgi:hypothetical protein
LIAYWSIISKPVLELAMCAKLKLIVNKAIAAFMPLGALLSANELNGKINISPNVIKK